MYIRVIPPVRRVEERGRAVVRADGAIQLEPGELRRLGVEAGTPLEVGRLPDGAALVAPDVCPTKLYLELTTECNLDCAMCVRRCWDEPGGRMAPRTFRRIIEQLAELPGVSTLHFGGFGEPMTHPDFLGFVALAKGAGCRVEVATNGTLLGREAAEQLVELRLDRLIVSLDGVRAAGHPPLHSRSFPVVYDNLRYLNDLRLARDVAWPEVAIEFVATKGNIGELPALRRLAPRLGFTSILVTNVVPYAPELADEILYERWTTAPRRRSLSPWTPSVNMPFTDAHSEAYAVIRRLIDGGAQLQLNGVDLTGAGPRCRFITEGRLAVTWEGQVSPCLPLMHSHSYYFRGEVKQIRCYRVGSVNETPLRELWASEGYRRFRDRVRRWEFSPCIDCGGCDLRETNEEDCFGDEFPRCGECLWAAGLVQCP